MIHLIDGKKTDTLAKRFKNAAERDVISWFDEGLNVPRTVFILQLLFNG